MKILICGYGNIGLHIHKEFQKFDKDIYIYDKYKTEYANTDLLNDTYDFAFVCVPTESRADGSCNTDEFFDIISKIQADTIVSKCTVPVGTHSSLRKTNVVFSPEFYGTTQHCSESPDFLVLSGDTFYCNKVQQLYQKVKNAYFQIRYTDYQTAELLKYMENCWLATKVTFCNEFASIANSVNVNYNELRELWLLDKRVNPSHTFVYADKPYYDSHCLNKDIPALIAQFPDKAKLMKSVLSRKLEAKHDDI